MSASLLVKPDLAPVAPQVHRITPESAGWRYVGFEVYDLARGRTLERSLPGREQCLVLLSGRVAARVGGRDFGTIGLRRTPFEGQPFALYAPPGATVSVTAATACELAVLRPQLRPLTPLTLERDPVAHPAGGYLKERNAEEGDPTTSEQIERRPTCRGATY